jgi:ATP-dependent RNA helicase DDX5/DBP2
MAWRIGSKPKVAPPVRSVAKADEASLPKVARDFYLEHPEVAALSREQADALRAELGIRVQGEGCPNPVGSFLQASFPQYVLDVLAGANYTAPTAIQRQAWPIAMQGQDLVGLAETGSGKTLAFLLPALVHVNAQPVLEEGDGPLAVVLAPTRELAVQIHEECVRFGHPCGVSTICIYGGVPKGPQVQALRKAPEILIATPGRLTDLLSSRKTELSRCT